MELINDICEILQLLFDISNDLNELNKINANYCANEISYRLNKKYKCELQVKYQNYKLIKFLYTLFNFYSVIYDIKYHNDN